MFYPQHPAPSALGRKTHLKDCWHYLGKRGAMYNLWLTYCKAPLGASCAACHGVYRILLHGRQRIIPAHQHAPTRTNTTHLLLVSHFNKHQHDTPTVSQPFHQAPARRTYC